MRVTALAAILVGAILTGCSGPAPTQGTGPSSGPAEPAATSTPAALATVPVSCHLTRPAPAFAAPSPYPALPPATYGSSWFGSPALWTMLHPEGETWSGLPRDKVGYSQKTFWWSTAWDPGREPVPAISVTGRQLDGPATLIADAGTNAFADFGAAMLVGIVLPAPGCWELTARYRGAALSYVVWVDGG